MANASSTFQYHMAISSTINYRKFHHHTALFCIWQLQRRRKREKQKQKNTRLQSWDCHPDQLRAATRRGVKPIVVNTRVHHHHHVSLQAAHNAKLGADDLVRVTGHQGHVGHGSAVIVPHDLDRHPAGT